GADAGPGLCRVRAPRALPAAAGRLLIAGRNAMDLAQTRKELAWRLHILNWLLIATCAAVFVLCLAFGSFSVVPLSLAKPLAMAAAFVLIANTYARVNRREA